MSFSHSSSKTIQNFFTFLPHWKSSYNQFGSQLKNSQNFYFRNLIGNFLFQKYFFFLIQFRLARCFYELKRNQEAKDCLDMFKVKFTNQAHNRALRALEKDIETAVRKNLNEKSRKNWKSKLDILGSEIFLFQELFGRPFSLVWPWNRLNPAFVHGTCWLCAFLKEVIMCYDFLFVFIFIIDDSRMERSVLVSLHLGGIYVADTSSLELQVSGAEKLWRKNACDFEHRYCGHCNATTDIKEANFFGR